MVGALQEKIKELLEHGDASFEIEDEDDWE